MKVQKHILFILLTLAMLAEPQTAQASAISSRALGDSLTAYVDFPPCVPRVRVKNLRVNRNSINLYTNKTLAALALDSEGLVVLRRQVSQWVLGHTQGDVKIYSDGYELGELLTDRVKARKENDRYTLTAHPALEYGEREWSAPKGLDNRNIALWPSHGMYYNQELNMWHWQRARLWTMVEDLYSYEYTHQWLIPMLENAGAYVLEPRAREGMYYNTKEDGSGVWLWLGDRVAPDGAPTRYIGDELGSIARGEDKITSGRPRWMEGARYWLEYTGFADSIWNMNQNGNDYKDDLQCRGLWVNYLSGGSRANPKQHGLGIQIDACLALHTDGYAAANDTDYIGTLAIYTDHDDSGRKTFPTGHSRMINRDLADYVQTQVVEDIRKQVEPRWTRRELNNAAYCESRYPVVPTVLLEILSHKNLADIMLGLDPKFQQLFCRAIYKGVGRWMIGEDFVVQPLPVHGVYCQVEEGQCRVGWEATTDSIEPSAKAEYFIVYTRKDGGDWDKGVRVNKNEYSFTMQEGIRYDVRVVAGNKGGISLDGEIVSARYASGDMTLVINNFHQICGPKWFVDSLRAGIVPGSYPTHYKESKTYLGDQWIYEKQRDVRENGWTDDDNCGWGMCHMDYVGKTLKGNSLMVEQLPDSGTYMVWNSESMILTQDTTHYSHIVIECREQCEDIFPASLRTFIEQQIAHGTELTIRGSMLGSGLNKEERKWAESTLGYKLAAARATVPAEKRNAPDAIKPAGKEGRVVRRYADTGLPCEIEIKKVNSTIRIVCE